MGDDADAGATVLEDFAPGETRRFRESWERTERIVLVAMAIGPLVAAFVLVTPVAGGVLLLADPVKGLGYTLPVVTLYELVLVWAYRKNHRLLEGYAGWELSEEGIRFPMRRDKETKELTRRFVPYEGIDAVYFRGTSRLVSIVWPTLPEHVRAEYGDDVPRALDDYVVVVEADEAYTAIEKDDVGDVEELKAALRERGVTVVG